MKGLKLRLGMGFAIIGLTAINLQADVLAAFYTFGSVNNQSSTTDPTPAPALSGVVFGSFTAVGYSGNPAAAGRFSWASNETGGMNGDDNFADFKGNLNEGKYFEVTLAPQASRTLDIDRITFGVRRSSTGIRSYAMRSSLDNFSANLPGSVNPPNPNLGIGPDNSFRWLFDGASTTSDQTGSRVDLGNAFDALGSPVTFRFYGWNAESSAGIFSIDDVCFLIGDAQVPEPGCTTSLFLGMVVFGVERRRRHRSP
jgi:hypothetical protein